MDCPTIRALAVAWLEGELAPGDTEQVDHHLEHCDECAAFVAALDSQRDDLAALRPEPDPRLVAPGFWDKMDERLAEEMDRAYTTPEPAPPAWQRPLRVSPIGLVAYAAALLLALGWGYLNLVDAREANARADVLGAELERERRLAAQPSEPARVEQYRPVAYTPRRGTF